MISKWTEKSRVQTELLDKQLTCINLIQNNNCTYD